MEAPASYDFAPIVRIALLGLVIAIGPLGWIWMRHRGASPAARLTALCLLTLFLTFDLVLFGAFTRLTDSGLGCPDWPGCYGNASPVGAHSEISAAQSAMPTGPVTHGKAWIEMVHRYLATAVGVLILVMTVTSWVEARRPRTAVSANVAGSPRVSPRVSPWWPTATLIWVCLQGAFGAWTVTLKLYPAIVTAHLLGGLGLLMLLAVQTETYRPRPLRLPRGVRNGVRVVFALVLAQVALGGWVSTNYAVLACTDFPSCHGSYWPDMNFREGFTVLRQLGETGDGNFISFQALTAIHYVHRLSAYVVLASTVLLAWRLHAQGTATLRRWSLALLAVAAWQLLSGLANVVLGWPLLAAVAHTGGAAAWVTMLTVLLSRTRLGSGQPEVEGAVPASSSRSSGGMGASTKLADAMGGAVAAAARDASPLPGKAGRAVRGPGGAGPSSAAS